MASGNDKQTAASCLDRLAQRDRPLAPYTYYGVGGRARWFAEPADTDALCELVRTCRDAGIRMRILGLGANLLVADDGVDDLVVRLQSRVFRKVDPGTSSAVPGGDEVELAVPGGADMARLTLDTCRLGLAGLERMAGIPGTLGGIIRMNAGGRYGEISDLVRDVTVVDEDGRLRTLSREQVGFRYRGTDLNGWIVSGATLRLRRDDPDRLRERMMEIWNYKRQSQPLGKSSAGCVFKNPTGRSAGQLIDRAGLKGRKVGGAMVSNRHANFIIAQEGATARDVLALIDIVRREVAERFGVKLELEIEVWGESPAGCMTGSTTRTDRIPA